MVFLACLIKIAEARARSMEDEIGRLHICLGEKDWELQASRSATKQVIFHLISMKNKILMLFIPY